MLEQLTNYDLDKLHQDSMTFRHHNPLINAAIRTRRRAFWREIMRRAGNPNLGEAAPSPFKRLLSTIDATPKWTAILPALLTMREHGSQEAKLFANEELRRMANTADQFVAARKIANKGITNG